MASVLIKPAAGSLMGTLQVPPDKSVTHRAIIFASAARGRSRISNFRPGGDNLATLGACRMLGVELDWHGGEVIVTGQGWDGLRQPRATIDCGNSGTTMRLLAGVLAGRPFTSHLDGDQSLRRRPMERIIEPLRKMGAKVQSDLGNGCAPLTLCGAALTGCSHQLEIASAQVKSAILLAGLQASGLTVVSEPAKSRDHTERMLPAFGVMLSAQGNQVSLEGPQELTGADLELFGDISSAAFFLVAAALIPGSHLVVEAVGLNPTRTGILELLSEMGALLTVKQTGTVAGEPVGMVEMRGGRLRGVEVGGEKLLKAIDEFPILCVAAALAEGETVIRDARELRVKESDRIAVMAAELGKLGADVEEMEDGLEIRGRERFGSGLVESHGDHRVAMALAVAGLAGGAEVEIAGGEAAEVSFPGYFARLAELVPGSVALK